MIDLLELDVQRRVLKTRLRNFPWVKTIEVSDQGFRIVPPQKTYGELRKELEEIEAKIARVRAGRERIDRNMAKVMRYFDDASDAGIPIRI